MTTYHTSPRHTPAVFNFNIKMTGIDDMAHCDTAGILVKCKAVNTVNISQMKHQLDATLCRFYFCRVTLDVSGASAHHQEYLKLVRRPLVHVLSLQVSHHISLLGPEHVE